MSEFRSGDDFVDAQRHTIWPVSRTGDLLVVAPSGDLVGFQTHGFQSEYERVLRLARSSRFRNVLIDLGAARYFGSEMIGTLINLSKALADQPPLEDGGSKPDGVLAVCNVSSDMQAGFEVMTVDQLWRTYESRAKAESELATISAGDRLRPLVRPLLTVAAVLLVVAVAAVLLVPSINERVFAPTAADDMELLESVDRRWQRMLSAKVSNEELVRTANDLRRDLSWAVRRFDRKDLTEEHEQVVQAALYLNEWLQTPSDVEDRVRYEKALKDARYALDN